MRFTLVRMYYKHPEGVTFANIVIEHVLPVEEALEFADECIKRDHQEACFTCHDVLVLEDNPDGLSVVEELYNERNVH
jgi:hypothetical protein